MDGTKNLIWLVLGLPLLGSIIQALFGGRVVATMGEKKGKWVMGLLAVAPIAIAFVIGLMLTLKLSGMSDVSRHAIVTGFDWIKIAGLHVPLEVIIDPLSMTMVLIITGIGALIHLYATGYMAADKEYPRFFTYLNLFIAAMLILVLGNNLALMFIGWEGVGLCSYLLIGFWYKDIENAKAANKAFIVNRIGDWGLTLGIFILIAAILNFNAPRALADERFLSYDVLLPLIKDTFENRPELATTIALLFFVGACGKSAQFPLYFWLPDAMAGPTPVSALIHAATMVTSGVFLLNRMNILFQLAPTASAIVAIVGAFTAIFAALIAFGQMDIKKVLAYSTVSQLGLMFVGCGAGYFWAGMFHVTTHAFFKALLFLGSGAVIYAMAHNQDMRNYGNLRKYVKITSGCMIIGWLAISGFPYMSGWFSKSAIVDGAVAQNVSLFNQVYNFGAFAGAIGLFGAFLTAIYMTRMTWMTFFNSEERWRTIEPHAEHHEPHEHTHHAAHDHGPDEHGFFYTDEELAAKHVEHEHHHELDREHTPREVPMSMWVPLAVLAVLSVVGGFALGRTVHVEGAPEGAHIAAMQHWLYPQGLEFWKEMPAVPPHEGTGFLLANLDPHTEIVAFSWAAVVLGILGGMVWYGRRMKNKLPASEGWDLAKWHPFRRSAANQFGYDSAIMTASVEGGGDLATAIWKKIDVGVIDRLVNGIGALSSGFGKFFGFFQGGYVRGYALMMLVGIAAFLAFLAVKAKPAPEQIEHAAGVEHHRTSPNTTDHHRRPGVNA